MTMKPQYIAIAALGAFLLWKKRSLSQSNKVSGIALPLKKAKYIINMVKSVGKTKDYAIDIVAWYTMTDKEQKDVEDLIKELW